MYHSHMDCGHICIHTLIHICIALYTLDLIRIENHIQAPDTYLANLMYWTSLTVVSLLSLIVLDLAETLFNNIKRSHHSVKQFKPHARIYSLSISSKFDSHSLSHLETSYLLLIQSIKLKHNTFTTFSFHIQKHIVIS